MFTYLWLACRFLRSGVRSRCDVALENLALRQQLVVLTRSPRRPRLTRADRLFWSWLSRAWPRWRSALVIGQRPTNPTAVPTGELRSPPAACSVGCQYQICSYASAGQSPAGTPGTGPLSGHCARGLARTSQECRRSSHGRGVATPHAYRPARFRSRRA